MKIKRHILGRFIENKKGSSFLKPIHGSRHLRAQMRFFGKSSRIGATPKFKL